MMTEITNRGEIEQHFENFEYGRGGAYPTCRLLETQYDQANKQEWVENGAIDGKPAKVFYIFENTEAEVEDGGEIPFDHSHICRILIGQ